MARAVNISCHRDLYQFSVSPAVQEQHALYLYLLATHQLSGTE
jgi:hypothetical protein